MTILSKETILTIQKLRRKGKTYNEINKHLNLRIPKNTLSYWCKALKLPADYPSKIRSLNIKNLEKARRRALIANRRKRKDILLSLDSKNTRLTSLLNDPQVSKIALSILCLGEASKYGKSSFYLGNSDPRVIVIFLELLKKIENFDPSKLRYTVQCRADQDVFELEEYWRSIVNAPPEFFYKTQIDPRTEGKPTKRLNYKGVLRVNYQDTILQLELESLVSLIYNKFAKKGPVV